MILILNLDAQIHFYLTLLKVFEKVSGISSNVLNFMRVDFICEESVKTGISIRNYSKVSSEETIKVLIINSHWP